MPLPLVPIVLLSPHAFARLPLGSRFLPLRGNGIGCYAGYVLTNFFFCRFCLSRSLYHHSRLHHQLVGSCGLSHASCGRRRIGVQRLLCQSLGHRPALFWCPDGRHQHGGYTAGNYQPFVNWSYRTASGMLLSSFTRVRFP